MFPSPRRRPKTTAIADDHITRAVYALCRRAGRPEATTAVLAYVVARLAGHLPAPGRAAIHLYAAQALTEFEHLSLHEEPGGSEEVVMHG